MKTKSIAIYEELRKRAQEVALLNSVNAHLHWDQQTYMPRGAGEYRAGQVAHLSALAHQRWTAPEVGEWLAAVSEEEWGLLEGANVREWKRSYDREVKLSERLVTDLARETSRAHEIWQGAREASDFALFAPSLERLLGLSLEMAECWGYEESRYDALMDGYEVGVRSVELAELFDSLATELSGLVLEGEKVSGESALPAGVYPVAAQVAFNQRVAEALGFDFSAGRIDTAAHPFCTTLGVGDIRLTTRYDEGDFTSSLLGVLHEAGHGLYEQGLLAEEFGNPAGTAVSLGIHESQSRLWENHIGRSLEFWQVWFSLAVEHFPQLAAIEPEGVFRHINRVQRSFIRVEADEVTYDLHIILRFRIERALVSGELAVKDLPEAWNEEFRKLFGMEVPDAARGCLQDVHWSGASFGYFPTYTLGNLNAAELFGAARAQVPGLESDLCRGNYGGLLEWLRESVHRQGSLFLPRDLMRRVIGRPVSSRTHLEHLRKKVQNLT